MAEDIKNPNAGEAETPDLSQEKAPSTSEPVATSLPLANKPDTEPTGSEKTPKAAKAKPAEGAPAAKAKKEKAPAVEDKPFAEFINQDFLPSLKTTLANLGIQDVQLSLKKQKLPIWGMNNRDEYWQVSGQFPNQRLFILGFLQEDIQGQKFFCCSDNGTTPSTLESFMIDERKTTLDLLVFYTTQRLNGQKWLVRN